MIESVHRKVDAPVSLGVLRSAHNYPIHHFFTCSKTAVLLLLAGASVLGYAENAKSAAAPHKAQVHIMRRSSTHASSQLREPFQARVAARPNLTPVNTGSGVVYTCDPTVAAATCTYLNTTVAGWYNSTFTNANAAIYIQYGTTGLGESTTGFYNFVTYDQYVAALTSNTGKSAIQTSALSALNTYAKPVYDTNYVELTGALGTTLGFSMTGTTVGAIPCTLPSAGCYDGIITVTNDVSTPLYYDNLGGPEPFDAYDYYGVVAHETDEVLGTSSCIDTQSMTGLVDDCDEAAPSGTGTPSAVDFYRYSSAGNLVLDSSLSTAPGAYFSYNGGSTNGANGKAGTPKVYNTLDNGDDYADFVSSTPDCGTNIAVQDAEGCPGEDAGLSILNDGGGEINILEAVGYNVPVSTPTPATLTSPLPGSTLGTEGVKFTWSAGVGATEYELRLGTTGIGSYNLYNSGDTTDKTVSVYSLPANGVKVYARLFSHINGWQYLDYTYMEDGPPAQLATPTPGTMLGTTNVKFTWTAGGGVAEYELRLGTTGVGSYNLYISGDTTAKTVTVPSIPANGVKVYARLFSHINGTWHYVDYTYTEP